MTAKQLTDSILQMAIQGKLVPQDPNDEPASVLLERIREKKRRLVAEGKLKANDIVEKPIEEQDIPYMTPQGWEWIRLNFVSSIARGGSPRPIKEYITDAPNGVNWIKISDTEKGGKYIYKTKEKIKPEGVSRSRFVHKDNFLLTNSMSFGRPYILKTEGCIHDGWLVISLEKDSYDQDFMYYLLSSAFAKKSFSDKAAGAVVKNLNIDKVAESIFPLPPLAEQRRIVERIEEYLPVIKEYGEAYDEAAKMDAELPDKLKKSILQEAIMGKLGTQDSNDEPASVLLEHIREEKRKLVKKNILKKKDLVEEPIEEEPFEIPENWAWIRFSSIFNVRSARRIHQTDWKKNGIPFFRGRELVQLIKNGEVDFEIYLSKELYEKLKVSGIPQKDDILISAVGTIGRVYVVKGNKPFYYKDAYILCCENIGKIYPHYIAMALTSPFLQSLIKKDSMATTVSQLTIERAKSLVIPFPPLAEQERIVRKVEELFAEIDNMTTNNINTIINETEETEKD